MDNEIITIQYKDKDIKIMMINGVPHIAKKELTKLYDVTYNTIANAIKKIDKKGAPFQKNEIVINHNHTKYYTLQILYFFDNKYNANNADLIEIFLNKRIESCSRDTTNLVRYNRDNISIDVVVSPHEKTVWLTQEQISVLFDTTRENITQHINNIYFQNELQLEATCKKNLQVQIEGERSIQRLISYYNLDMILAIGYRVNGTRGIEFRKWATMVLKAYLTDGVVIRNLNENELMLTKILELESQYKEIEAKVESILKKRFLFLKGKAYEAFSFLSGYIAQAKRRIVYIDPYADKFTLSVLTAKEEKVKAIIIGSKYSDIDEESLALFKRQCGEISFLKNNDNHDRYLIIDDNRCLEIGASLNSFGYHDFHITINGDKSFVATIIERYIN